MSKMNVPGLKAIQIPQDPEESPILVTDREKVREIYPGFQRGQNTAHALTQQEVDADPEIAEQLLAIQDACQFLAARGWNNNRTGVEDFYIAVIDTDPDGDGAGPWVFADLGIGLGLKHKKTGKTAFVDLFYPKRRNHSGSRWPHGAYTTAIKMIELGGERR